MTGSRKIWQRWSMVEIFLVWGRLKAALWGQKSAVVFKQGDIWWCCIGMNIGEEAFGKGPWFTRPVLVLKKFTSNSFLGLPLTRKEKRGSWYVEVELHGKKSFVMLNQARVFDKKRMRNRIETLDTSVFELVRTRFLEFYASEK